MVHGGLIDLHISHSDRLQGSHDKLVRRCLGATSQPLESCLSDYISDTRHFKCFLTAVTVQASLALTCRPLIPALVSKSLRVLSSTSGPR